MRVVSSMVFTRGSGHRFLVMGRNTERKSEYGRQNSDFRFAASITSRSRPPLAVILHPRYDRRYRLSSPPASKHLRNSDIVDPPAEARAAAAHGETVADDHPVQRRGWGGCAAIERRAVIIDNVGGTVIGKANGATPCVSVVFLTGELRFSN
jgi:hypothetical protein